MIAVIKYNAGNIFSVQNALARLGEESILTDDEAIILKADKVIFPGVGEASSAMNYLKNSGLDKTILQIKKPMLGICLGLQLMCKSSEEGNVPCLGIFENEVKKFKSTTEKVPHMGWNNFSNLEGALLDNIDTNADMYYVHSYYATLSQYTKAVCNYINPFSAVLQKDNFYATQFHPEKSADIGEQLLKNFLKL